MTGMRAWATVAREEKSRSVMSLRQGRAGPRVRINKVLVSLLLVHDMNQRLTRAEAT